MRRTTLDKIRENLRLQQVYNTLLRYGWDFVYERVPVLGNFRRSMQSWAWQIPKEDLESISDPVKLRLMLEELGPTYVKMGQIVSSQSSVIPPDWEAELEKLQSSVPPFPSDVVREIIIEELGAPPEELYATFEKNPFAAASTAQVHCATLMDGTRVAVKVQRPNIYTQMKADIGIMQNAARVMSARSEYARSIDLVGMLDQFGDSVLNELDYTGEAYNALRLSKDMESIPGVRVPTIYSPLSTSKILTMDFVEGVKISNTERIDQAGLDRKDIAVRVLRGLIKQLLIDGFFHADPHPGNILVNLSNGEIVFLDTGMVGELDVQQRLNLIQLLYAIKQQDAQSMAQIMRNLSEPFIKNVDEKGYQKAFERMIGRFMISGQKINFGQLVNSALNLLREYGLRLNPNLTMAIKALMQAEAIATALSPDGGMLADGVAITQELALQEITADRIVQEAKKQLVATGRELLKRMPSLTDATLSWLTQYQKGRFEVTINTSELAKEVDKISNFGRQAVIAIILVGMIIGSAIATAAIAFSGHTDQFSDFIFKLSYFCFIFSVIIASIIVMRLVWRWMRGKRASED